MINATLKDLELELWLRNRNSGELVWTTKTQKQVPIKDMTDTHLHNTLRMLCKIVNKKLEREEEWNTLMDIGTVDPNDCL